MAKDATGRIWVFDAAGDAEGLANVGVAGVIFDTVRPYIRSITVITAGTSGATTIRETSSTSSRPVLITPSMDVQSSYTEHINDFVDGLYLHSLPTSAKVYIYHGDPEGSMY